MIPNTTNNDIQQTIGKYTYQSSSAGDAINDNRFYSENGAIIFERCTGLHATKGSGTWIDISSNTGITLTVDNVIKYLSGIKNYIASTEELTIPIYYEYNTFILDNDGIINNNGTINFL